MTDPMTVALVSAGAASGSSLLTILLSPRLQHLFWRYQRRAELRLAAISEIGKLSGEFLTEYITAPTTYKPSADFYKTWLAVTANLKALFSRAAFDAFKELDNLIGTGHPQLGPQGNKGVHDFIEARDRALRTLYGEVIPLTKS